jgi:hypothetical protein
MRAKCDCPAASRHRGNGSTMKPRGVPSCAGGSADRCRGEPGLPHRQRCEPGRRGRQAGAANRPPRAAAPNAAPFDIGASPRRLASRHPVARRVATRRRRSGGTGLGGWPSPIPQSSHPRLAPLPPNRDMHLPGGRRRTGASPTRSGPEGSSRNEFPPGSLSGLPLASAGQACRRDACPPRKRGAGAMAR